LGMTWTSARRPQELELSIATSHPACVLVNTGHGHGASGLLLAISN
jgi:hypothetical protein